VTKEKPYATQVSARSTRSKISLFFLDEKYEAMSNKKVEATMSSFTSEKNIWLVVNIRCKRSLKPAPKYSKIDPEYDDLAPTILKALHPKDSTT
jgi:hypothetical protein